MPNHDNNPALEAVFEAIDGEFIDADDFILEEDEINEDVPTISPADIPLAIFPEIVKEVAQEDKPKKELSKFDEAFEKFFDLNGYTDYLIWDFQSRLEDAQRVLADYESLKEEDPSIAEDCEEAIKDVKESVALATRQLELATDPKNIEWLHNTVRESLLKTFTKNEFIILIKNIEKYKRANECLAFANQSFVEFINNTTKKEFPEIDSYVADYSQEIVEDSDTIH